LAAFQAVVLLTQAKMGADGRIGRFQRRRLVERAVSLWRQADAKVQQQFSSKLPPLLLALQADPIAQRVVDDAIVAEFGLGEWAISRQQVAEHVAAGRHDEALATLTKAVGDPAFPKKAALEAMTTILAESRKAFGQSDLPFDTLRPRLAALQQCAVAAGATSLGERAEALLKHLGRIEGMSLVTVVGEGAFYLDNHELTVGQYRSFLEAVGAEGAAKHMPRYAVLAGERTMTTLAEPAFAACYQGGALSADAPIIGITAADAAACAKWLGKRLPTLGEYKTVAKGVAKLTGGEPPAPAVRPINVDRTDLKITPVTRPFADVNGKITGLAGNVREWCVNEATQAPVVFGMSYLDKFRPDWRTAGTAKPPGYRDHWTGFRCAADPLPPEPDDP